MFTPKFSSNQYIEEFADGKQIFRDNLKAIKVILDDEAKKPIKDNPFSDQKGIKVDPIAKAKKINGIKSADMVTILGKNVLLFVDAKLNSKTASDIIQNPKDTAAKFPKTRELMMENPRYTDMGLSVYPKFILIMPDKDFKQIQNVIVRISPKSPELMPMRVSDFYSTFFAS